MQRWTVASSRDRDRGRSRPTERPGRASSEGEGRGQARQHSRARGADHAVTTLRARRHEQARSRARAKEHKTLGFQRSERGEGRKGWTQAGLGWLVMSEETMPHESLGLRDRHGPARAARAENGDQRSKNGVARSSAGAHPRWCVRDVLPGWPPLNEQDPEREQQGCERRNGTVKVGRHRATSFRSLSFQTPLTSRRSPRCKTIIHSTSTAFWLARRPVPKSAPSTRPAGDDLWRLSSSRLTLWSLLPHPRRSAPVL